jgi:hypothetical protein
MAAQHLSMTLIYDIILLGESSYRRHQVQNSVNIDSLMSKLSKEMVATQTEVQ